MEIPFELKIPVIEESEKLSHEKRLKSGIYETIHKWFREPGGLKRELSHLMTQKSLTKPHDRDRIKELDKKHAELGAKLIRAIRIFTPNDEVARKHAPLIWQEIFDTRNPNSVVNWEGGAIKKELIGPISILTFVNLMGFADPKLREKLHLGEIITPPETDVIDKVDLILRFGDTNAYTGKEIIRLIQLKTTPGNETIVWGYNQNRDSQTDARWKDQEEVIKKIGVTNDYLNKMVRYGKRIEEENKNIETQVFVVQVPAYDSEMIGNAFGIIQGEKGKVVKEKFKDDARKQRLIPTQ